MSLSLNFSPFGCYAISVRLSKINFWKDDSLLVTSISSPPSHSMNPWGSGFCLQQPDKPSFTKITNDTAPNREIQWTVLISFLIGLLCIVWIYGLFPLLQIYFVEVQYFKLPYSLPTTIDRLPSRALPVPSVLQRSAMLAPWL